MYVSGTSLNAFVQLSQSCPQSESVKSYRLHQDIVFAVEKVCSRVLVERLHIFPRWGSKPVLWHAATGLPLAYLEKKKILTVTLQYLASNSHPTHPQWLLLPSTIHQHLLRTEAADLKQPPHSPREQAGGPLRCLGPGEPRGSGDAEPAHWLRGLSRNDPTSSVLCTPEHRAPLRAHHLLILVKHCSWL